MSAILSYPFRLGLNGTIATVEQASEQAHTEQIAVLALTRLGERDLRPGFGITDPAFGTMVAGELAAKVGLYGPPVVIYRIESVHLDDSAQRVTVEFSEAA